MSVGLRKMPIERVQSFWDARPCNIRHSSRPVGTREYFDEVEARKYFVEPHIPKFADFPRWKGKRVLELGCGIGTDTINFARAGASITAVDLSPVSLDVARQRARVYGLENRIAFINGNAEELSRAVPVEPFDLVYAFGVIHHTPRPDRVLAEVRRYLKPDGVLKLMVYHLYSWKVLCILLGYGHGQFWRLPELIARHSEAQSGCPITYAYSRAGASRLLENCNFRVTRCWIDHIFPYRVAEYVQYRYRKEWWWRWLPSPRFRALERQFGWHLLIEAARIGC